MGPWPAEKSNVQSRAWPQNEETKVCSPPGVQQAAALGAPKGGPRRFTVLHLNPRNPAWHEKHTEEDPVRSKTGKVLRGIYDHRDERFLCHEGASAASPEVTCVLTLASASHSLSPNQTEQQEQHDMPGRRGKFQAPANLR